MAKGKDGIATETAPRQPVHDTKRFHCVENPLGATADRQVPSTRELSDRAQGWLL